MKDINYLISQFEEEFDESTIEKGEKLRKEFINEFPIDYIKDMPKEKYALGLDIDNQPLCWWLEYKETVLGSIKGGSALKYKIYYSRKKDDWYYPDGFDNVDKAWKELREQLYDFIINFGKNGYTKIDSTKMISTMYTLRSKLLYMYYPEKVMPIYNLDHIKKALKAFDYDSNKMDSLDINQANIELKKLMNEYEQFDDWNTLKFMKFLYKTVIYKSQYYKIAPGEEAKLWDDCYENNYIRLGWDKIGDLRQFADYDEFLHAFHNEYKDLYDQKGKATEKANEVWTFFNLKTGDKILANKGISKVVGFGEVDEEGYFYNEDFDEYCHIISVDWVKDFKETEIKPKNYWALKTVYEVGNDILDEIKVDNNNEDIKITFKEKDTKIFKQIETNLEQKRNVILHGPPGTGKTYLALEYLKWRKQNNDKKIFNEFITFHPSFSYEDFIEGYKPNTNDDKPDFTLQDGTFKKICNEASKEENKDNEYYLIIDEINRGDVAKIFGEMITLLEKDKRNLKITLSQSDKCFSVPENLYIIATMNTSDKSIKVMDAALRRRFRFIECMPQYSLIDSPIEKLNISPADILNKINKDLRDIEDREKQIGHAYFMKDDKQIENIEELREVYVYEIIPLVGEYCFNEYEKMGEIIGEKFIDKDNEVLKDDLMQVEDFFSNTIIEKFGETK